MIPVRLMVATAIFMFTTHGLAASQCRDAVTGPKLPALPNSWTHDAHEKLDDVAPLRRLKSVTGGLSQPSAHDFGDPSPPDFHYPEGVRVYTSNGIVLTWPKKIYGQKTIDAFLKGLPARVEILKIYYPDLTPVEEDDIWDPTIEKNSDGEYTLYGSLMRRAPGETQAKWPDDNWSRRTYAFTLKKDRWVMSDTPLFGTIPEQPTWIGHSYGHSFITGDDGSRYVFYERVTEDKNGLPWVTAIFARKMNSPTRARNREIEIFNPGTPPWPATVRASGGSLVEGPRIVKFANGFLVAFSSGDYTSANYGINFLWSESIEGPYKPYLNHAGTDLKDFGHAVERVQQLTWGAGRAAPFEVGGQWWTLFHGIPTQEGQAPPQDGLRDIYLAPMDLHQLMGKSPSLKIRASHI